MDQSAEQLGALLDRPVPPASNDDAVALARLHFGLTGTATPLTGERDRNFHLTDTAGREFVLKIGHPEEDPAVLDLQDQALLHAALRDPSLPLPRVHLPISGKPVLWHAPGAQPRVVRVLSYVQGRPLHSTEPSAARHRDIGSALARLNLSLADFRHPADGHDLLWDLQRAARVRPLLIHVDPARRGLPTRFFDQFETYALPVLPHLRAQLIHNDFNPHNMLTDPADDTRLVGIIDFGDMVRAPMVQDLATAAAYHVTTGADALRGVAEIVAAYHAICPLLPEEIAVLPDLLGARLSLSIAISSWRAVRHPDNAPYILRNQGRTWTGLAGLDAIPREDMQAILRNACQLG
ncbi:phosphotransferase [Acidisphaera sp. L21]|uniref:phosphotransferase n=1 Tax=Acidisphaera sp. L21 TaxID=1641851 RepID=UPI00131AC0D3|nr:phosphotransferase [Acidisphaera sp. L21]